MSGPGAEPPAFRQARWTMLRWSEAMVRERASDDTPDDKTDFASQHVAPGTQIPKEDLTGSSHSGPDPLLFSSPTLLEARQEPRHGAPMLAQWRAPVV